MVFFYLTDFYFLVKPEFAWYHGCVLVQEKIMKVADIAQIVEGKIVCGEKFKDKAVETACGSDMMSDVMAFYHDRGLLLTGLVNIQVIRTASLLDLDGICFVRGKKPTDEMKALADEDGLFIIETEMPMFPACGKLFSAGLKGNDAH